MDDDRFAWRDAFKIVGANARTEPGTVLLMPAGPEHAAFALACRSDMAAVAASRTGIPIAPAEHATWWARMLGNPGIRMRVAIVDDHAVGTVRVDVACGTGDVGIAIHPDRRGEHLATPMLLALVTDCLADPQVVHLNATIRPDNEASLRAFAAAGFEPAADRDGFRVLRRPVRKRFA
jgi:RimJ/RimL family protein N-acetyltransferase